jgi:hypothetical protein
MAERSLAQAGDGDEGDDNTWLPLWLRDTSTCIVALLDTLHSQENCVCCSTRPGTFLCTEHQGAACV